MDNLLTVISESEIFVYNFTIEMANSLVQEQFLSHSLKRKLGGQLLIVARKQDDLNPT